MSPIYLSPFRISQNPPPPNAPSPRYLIYLCPNLGDATAAAAAGTSSPALFRSLCDVFLGHAVVEIPVRTEREEEKEYRGREESGRGVSRSAPSHRAPLTFALVPTISWSVVRRCCHILARVVVARPALSRGVVAGITSLRCGLFRSFCLTPFF